MMIELQASNTGMRNIMATVKENGGVHVSIDRAAQRPVSKSCDRYKNGKCMNSGGTGGCCGMNIKMGKEKCLDCDSYCGAVEHLRELMGI